MKYHSFYGYRKRGNPDWKKEVAAKEIMPRAVIISRCCGKEIKVSQNLFFCLNCLKNCDVKNG